MSISFHALKQGGVNDDVNNCLAFNDCEYSKTFENQN